MWPLIFYLAMATLYISGALIYIYRFPESRSPGRFDYCGQSHNLWHCFVLLAALSHYVAAIESYRIRQALVCS